MQTATVKLPFEGFYESLYSGAIDGEEESFIEYRLEEGESDPDYEGYFPEPLRLDAQEMQEILIRVTDYRAAYERIARDYVDAFDYVLGEELGFSVKDKSKKYNYETKDFEEYEYDKPSIRATFESMDSPREYNFTTDRVYADIPLAFMYLFFRKSRAENHSTLATVIKERFTSRDGFLSHYPNRLADWLEKPLSDWDHNELETLLLAAMRLAGIDDDSDELRWRLYESTVGDEGAYQAWESAVDWQKFETMRNEARAEKLQDWIDEDIEAAAVWRANHRDAYNTLAAVDPHLESAFDGIPVPYRCPETPDLFSDNHA